MLFVTVWEPNLSFPRMMLPFVFCNRMQNAQESKVAPKMFNAHRPP